MADLDAIRERDAAYVGMGWDFDAEPPTGRAQMAQDRHRLLATVEALKEALTWAMAPNPRYEGRHRTEPRCAEFMPTDGRCDCGYREAAITLASV